MPRNGYTKLVHKVERAQIDEQIEEAASLAKELGHKDAASNTVQAAGDAKERRRTRLEEKRRHKP
ncbi:hypothetical protein EDD99_5168 [Streptomyces sp. 846.5]|nr:hypothetical protein [Streptomyces sp. 846.5]TDU06605.1 hypothetical protein EDD99_5168 [Streptomyces sp. 846.5]